MAKHRENKSSKKYRSEGRRYKNKMRKMLKRIKNMKPATQERILKLNPIKHQRGRDYGENQSSSNSMPKLSKRDIQQGKTRFSFM